MKPPAYLKERCFALVGALVVVYGAGRMFGTFPPEAPPAWAITAIGAALFAEVVVEYPAENEE